MAHKMLEGKVIKGNHEKLVSTDVFLKVNGLLDQNTHGYKINEENDALPLKRFAHCDHCGKPLRGYLARKKNIYYYKCNTVGCGDNKNANSLNKTFEKILGGFNLDVSKEMIKLIKIQTVATYNQLVQEEEDSCLLLKQQHRELMQKMERLDERYIAEEVNMDLYNRYADKYKEEKKEIESDILKVSRKKSNLEECVDIAVDFASELPSKWLSADYLVKQQIQVLLFPNGISYNKKNDGCRTKRINRVFGHIACLVGFRG